MAAARENDGDVGRTVFMVPSFDQDTLKHVDADVMREWFRELVSNGAAHIAYDSDDYMNGIPALDTVRLMMSKDAFPAESE